MSDYESTVMGESPEMKRLSEMRDSRVIDTSMLDSLRVNCGVLQCRVKVQKFNGYGDAVSPVMWEWSDVQVTNEEDI
jgi:hypothetical protein